MMNLNTNYLLAGSPEIPMTELLRLSFHPDENVRRRIADRKRITHNLLEALAADSCPEVRSAVAANPQTSLSVLLMLVVDPSDDVRFSMAENHKLPKFILDVLARDSNPYVQWRAHVTLNHLKGS